MNDLLLHVASRVHRSETGAIGALLVGVILGIALVIFGVIKFLIPGE